MDEGKLCSGLSLGVYGALSLTNSGGLPFASALINFAQESGLPRPPWSPPRCYTSCCLWSSPMPMPTISLAICFLISGKAAHPTSWFWMSSSCLEARCGQEVGPFRSGRLNTDLVHGNVAMCTLGSKGPEKSRNLCFGCSLFRGRVRHQHMALVSFSHGDTENSHTHQLVKRQGY